MDDDLTIQQLIEIRSEMDALTEEAIGPCECDKHLEIKMRQFGGGKHYVKQCNACGEQRGGSLKAADALGQLGGGSPKDFDSSIGEARRLRSKMRSERAAELLDEASRLKLLLYGQPDWRAQQIADTEKRDKAATGFSQYVDGLVEQFGIDGAVGFLVRETVRLKKRTHDEFRQTVSRFTSEGELKKWFESQFSKDFEIFPEVRGRHLAEDVTVRIDYLLKARKHLLDAGFEARPFGVEIKYFCQEDGFTHKTSRGLWQTISYNDCEFDLEGVLHRPKFCLLFSNLSFEGELRLINSFGFEYENDKFEWRGMLHLANHANVGCLNSKGTKDQCRGWEMRFVGGIYFSCSTYQEKSTYHKSNENVINKVRIGNF